jgi:hypothetical protein
MRNQTLSIEFAKIKNQNGGKLIPQDVVNAARPKGAPLHKFFDWSDRVAGEKWRICQARNLIRIHCTIIATGDTVEKVRAFYSLVPDRYGENRGGYRVTADILNDEAQRRQLLDDALAELGVFQRKYRMLAELADVFAAINRVTEGTTKADAA